MLKLTNPTRIIIFSQTKNQLFHPIYLHTCFYVSEKWKVSVNIHEVQKVKLFPSSSESEKKKNCFQKESESWKFSNSPKTHPRPFYNTWWPRMCYNGEFKLRPSKVACMCSVYCRYILSQLNIASQSNALQCAHCGFPAETAALDMMAWFCRECCSMVVGSIWMARYCIV